MRFFRILPLRAKALLAGIVLFDAIVLFVPPGVTAAYGVSLVQHVLGITAIQGVCAAAALGVVFYYRPDDEELPDNEYKYQA